MPPPIIDRLSPSIGWPGGPGVDGTLVIIHGRHFHPTEEMARNQVSFTAAMGGSVPAPVEWASIDEVDYQPGGVVLNESLVPDGLDGPRGIAINRGSGDLYVADTGQHRIIRFTRSGSVSSWGSEGSGDGELNRPTGIAVDAAGAVYVADTMNHRIQKFSATGGFITSWGTHGSGLGQFDMPVDVAVARIGGQELVYVADSNNHRVARSDTAGNHPTQLLTPADCGRLLGVCVPQGYGFVYASDPSNRRVYRWAWHGPFNGYFGAAGPHNLAEVDVGYPMGLAQDFDGYVYVADNAGRVIRKFDAFDPGFREIARFGLTPSGVPGPTPVDQLVDPVDVAVTDFKTAYIVDRGRNQIVRFSPTDSQELWVHVPEGAVSGDLTLRTDDGTTTANFLIWDQARVEVENAFLTQGLVEYPPVAGKRTAVIYQMRTVGAAQLGSFCWGSPVTDSAVCRVFKDGVEVHRQSGVVEFQTMTGGFLSTQIAFEIRFEIPYWAVNEQANYRFRVNLERSGPYAFSHSRDFPDSSGVTFHNRQRYRILASPITHLTHDGSRVGSSDLYTALFYVGADLGHMVDWLDWSQLYSGYAHYNRLYPLRYSLGDIADWGIWVNGTMHDGINSEGETLDILEVLELTRRRLNEGGGADTDYMLGIVHRPEVTGTETWRGVTSDAYRTALITVGTNLAGDPAYDVGSIIAHELLHQHAVDHQSTHELASSAQPGWNPVTGSLVRFPVTLMFDSGGAGRAHDWNDETTFSQCRHEGTPGSYDVVYDALANPRPTSAPRRERLLSAAERPSGCPGNFTLIGHLRRDGDFVRAASWVGRGDTAVTAEAHDGEGVLCFLDAAGQELLRWRVRLVFGLRTIDATGEGGSLIALDSAPLSVTCPCPSDTTRIEVLREAERVWWFDKPAQAPTVELIRPRGGESIAPTDQLTVEWQASHPQGWPLAFRLEYSSDEGEHFRPLALGLTGTSYIGPAGLAASSGVVRLRVTASDGFHEASDVSDDIKVEDVARRVQVVQPRFGAVVAEGQPFRVMALANDLEVGAVTLTTANTRWLLDGEAILGDGNDFDVDRIELSTPLGVQTTPLSIGPHRLRVEVRLAGGGILVDEIPIEVAADTDRDGVPDGVEIARGTDPTDPADRSSVAPVYLLGQWRFRRWHSATKLQIAHLLSGQLKLELGFIDEAGAALAGHPVRLIRGWTQRTAVTDAEGWVAVELDSLCSVLVLLQGSARRPCGFGVIRLRISRDSGLTRTQILAHGWIARRHGCWLFRGRSQGTFVINAGRPLSIRGAQAWRASSPRMALPALGHRTLGRLRLATRRLGRQVLPSKDG